MPAASLRQVKGTAEYVYYWRRQLQQVLLAASHPDQRFGRPNLGASRPDYIHMDLVRNLVVANRFALNAGRQWSVG